MIPNATPRKDQSVLMLRPERRQKPRIRTARIVRLIQGEREWLAGCRDISDTGMKLDTGISLTPGDAVTIIFSPHVVLHAHVVWSEDETCGLSLDREVDSIALLTTSALEARAAESAALEHRNRGAQRPAASRPARHGFNPGLRVTLLEETGEEDSTFLLLPPGQLPAIGR